jgi:hypothetical protein
MSIPFAVMPIRLLVRAIPLLVKVKSARPGVGVGAVRALAVTPASRT